MKDLQTSDPKAHSQNIRNGIRDLIDHIRKDNDQVEDAKAKALFETSAEVLIGLETAFFHYEKGEEKAWRE